MSFRIGSGATCTLNMTKFLALVINMTTKIEINYLGFLSLQIGNIFNVSLLSVYSALY